MLFQKNGRMDFKLRRSSSLQTILRYINDCEKRELSKLHCSHLRFVIVNRLFEPNRKLYYTRRGCCNHNSYSH